MFLNFTRRTTAALLSLLPALPYSGATGCRERLQVVDSTGRRSLVRAQLHAGLERVVVRWSTSETPAVGKQSFLFPNRLTVKKRVGTRKRHGPQFSRYYFACPPTG